MTELSIVAIAGLVAGLLLALFIQAGFVLWGAKIAGIAKRSFGRAIAVTLLGGIASWLLVLAFTAATGIGGILGLVVGFFATAVVMMPIFDTGFGKAFGATVLSWLLGLIVIGGGLLLIALLGGGAALLAQGG